MKQTEKKSIGEALKHYCELKGSQNRAAASLKGVSSATVSCVLNNNWELITDDMWRKISTQIGFDSREWVIVKTRGYKRMYDLLTSSQQDSLVFAVIGDAGSGKTAAINSYAKTHKNVFNLSCSEFWNRKHFMTELLQNMSVDYTGCTVAEMMGEIIFNLNKMDKPLLILDEADKLSDQVLYFFITLYNKLEDRCGIILAATDFLEKRIKKGVRQNRKGYKEIYSRAGRKFIPLQVVNSEDVVAVCRANGVEDTTEIQSIIDDCENDLRRVKRRIHAYKSKH